MRVTLEPLNGTSKQIQDVQKVLEEAPEYAIKASGDLSNSNAASSLFAALPERVSASSKFVYGINLNSIIVGCIDIIRGYPSRETAMLGLLLLSEKHQGIGLGGEAYSLLEREMKQWPEIQKIRIAIIATNEKVIPFWIKMGFADTSIKKTYIANKINSICYIFEKNITK